MEDKVADQQPEDQSPGTAGPGTLQSFSFWQDIWSWGSNDYVGNCGCSAFIVIVLLAAIVTACCIIR